MKICVISQGYPYPGVPLFNFVEQLCNEMADQGNEIRVVAPHSLFRPIVRHEPHIPYKQVVPRKGSNIIVYTPKVLSVGNLPIIGDTLNNFFVSKALKHTLHKQIGEWPDVYYCHFWSEAIKAFPEIKDNKKPIIVASGEASLTRKNDGTPMMQQLVERVKGVVCVSTKNLKESVKSGLTTEEKCRVFPNSIDNKLFHPMSKHECREKLGIELEDFVVSYVGFISHRKGSKRVSKAIEMLNDKSIKSIFIGNNVEGNAVDPDCNGIIFKGKLDHEKIPLYLGASDVFVLPTRHEGCCNAIVEALACGLPVISSDRDFNYDILDSTNSILVDPDDVEAISQAIFRIKSDKTLRLLLSAGAIEKSKELTIEKRAKKILDFIKESIGKEARV